MPNTCDRCNRELKDPTARYGWRCAQILGVSEALNNAHDNTWGDFLRGIKDAGQKMKQFGGEKDEDKMKLLEAVLRYHLSTGTGDNKLINSEYRSMANAMDGIDSPEKAVYNGNRPTLNDLVFRNNAASGGPPLELLNTSKSANPFLPSFNSGAFSPKVPESWAERPKEEEKREAPPQGSKLPPAFRDGKLPFDIPEGKMEKWKQTKEPDTSYNGRIELDPLDLAAMLAEKLKPNFTPRKDKRHGSENRQPSGDRERNVGHPGGEEHSRVPKGPKGKPRGSGGPMKSDAMENIGKGVVVAGAAVGAGYLLYRILRIIPSLLPPLWWTLPANLVMP